MAMSVRYTTINGRIVAESRGGTRKYYSSDALRSTVALYDDSGSKTDSFKYWPYGATRARTGNNPTKYKFVGVLGCTEQADGGIYMQARIEDPEDGRFMTADTIRIFGNLYGYALCRPTSLADPSGRFPREFCFGFCAPICVAEPPLCASCLDLCDGASTIDDLRIIADKLNINRQRCFHPKNEADCFMCPGRPEQGSSRCEECCRRLHEGEDATDSAMNRCQCWCRKLYLKAKVECGRYPPIKKKQCDLN